MSFTIPLPSPVKFCDESLCADEDNSININDDEQADQNVIDETMDINHLDDKDFYSVNESKDHQTALVDFCSNILSHSFDQSDKKDVNGISHCDKEKVNIIDHSNKEINCIGPCNKEEVNSSVHSDKFKVNGVDHSDSKEVNSIDQDNKYEINRIDHCDTKEYICIGHSNKEVTIENLNECKGNKRQLDFSSASESSGTFMILRSRKKRRVNEQVPSMLQTETMSAKLATKNESLNEELGNDPPITRRRSREMGIKINELKPRGHCRKHQLSIKNKDDEQSSTVLDQISNNAQFPKSAAHVHDGEENISQPVEEIRQCLATETVSSKGVTKQFSDSYDQDNFCQDAIHCIDDNDIKKTDKAHSSLQPSNDEVEEYSKNLVNLQVSSLDIDQDNYENCVDKLQSSYHQLKEESENHSNEQECCENEDEEQSKNLSHMQQSCYDQDQEKFHDQSVQLRCVNDRDQKQSQDRLDQQQSIKHQGVEQSLNQSNQQQFINDQSHEQSQDQLDQQKSVSYQDEEHSRDLSDQQQFILDEGQEKSKDLLDQQPSCYDQGQEQCINERDQKQSMDFLDHQPFINDQGEEQSNNQLDQQQSCYDHGQEQLMDQPDEHHFSNNKDKGQSDNLLDLQQDQEKSENTLDKQHYSHGKFFGKKVPSTNFCNMVQLDENKTTSGHVEIVDQSSENRDLDIFMQSSNNGVEKICRTINSTNRERTETTDDKSKYSYRKCGVTVCLDEKNSETLHLPEETVKNMSQDQVRSVICKNVKTPTSKNIHKSSLTPTAVSKMLNTNKGRCKFELMTSANETSNLPCSTDKSQVATTSCKNSLIPNEKKHLSVSFEERLLEELSPIPTAPEKIRPVDSPETIRRPFDTIRKTRRSIDTPEKIKSVDDCNFDALDYPPLSPIPSSPTKTEQLAASAHIKMKNSVCGFAKDLPEVNKNKRRALMSFL
ncbi:uncharacterized protein LOC124452567 isoform X1 [Xenia sp. Carnegie-2017]|uniref:uncharacterized protein LOC124452567 isoform X1 n=1 Tax=Xenia sp. Carnegie-2017 TaxID=2897299 RepID=UPI001F044BE4|nr:uncharacterized protein LOC124452567 isoform X1 [Xenia sp. Carnegie-2017]